MTSWGMTRVRSTHVKCVVTSESCAGRGKAIRRQASTFSLDAVGNVATCRVKRMANGYILNQAAESKTDPYSNTHGGQEHAEVSDLGQWAGCVS